jgi:outer membrane protein assembly factor BamB
MESIRKMKKNKTKTSYWFFGVAFILLFLFVLSSNLMKQSRQVIQLPGNHGLPQLRTQGKLLIAYELSDEFHMFDWEHLQDGYQTRSAKGKKAVWLQTHGVVSLTSAGSILVEKEQPGQLSAIPLHVQGSNGFLVAGESENVVLIQEFLTDQKKNYTFYHVDLNKEIIREIETVSGDKEFSIQAVVVSDLSQVVYAAGVKDGQGYLTAINMPDQCILWEQSNPDETKYYSLVSDDKQGFLWVGTHEGTVLKIDSATGEIKDRKLLVPVPRPNTNNQFISTLAINPQGTLLAASCDPVVYLIDAAIMAVHKEIIISHKIVAGLAFSPDGKSLATSDLRASGVIQIHSIEQ